MAVSPPPKYAVTPFIVPISSHLSMFLSLCCHDGLKLDCAMTDLERVPAGRERGSEEPYCGFDFASIASTDREMHNQNLPSDNESAGWYVRVCRRANPRRPPVEASSPQARSLASRWVLGIAPKLYLERQQNAHVIGHGRLPSETSMNCSNNRLTRARSAFDILTVMTTSVALSLVISRTPVAMTKHLSFTGTTSGRQFPPMYGGRIFWQGEWRRRSVRIATVPYGSR
jgi:hypothetical protein